MLVCISLSCSSTTWSNTKSINHIIQTRFTQLQQNLTCNTRYRVCSFIHIQELTLKNSVCIFCFLFFFQLNCIFRLFTSSSVWTVLSWRVFFLFEAFIVTKDWLSKSSCNFCFWSCISCHFLLNFEI